MKKIRCRHKRKILFPLILITIPVIVYLLKISGGYLAGSKVDWLSQHSVFPEYFRQRFYDTGNFFPDLAMELGGGQNIYNFAYYGLYNPLYLLSYILPFIRMTDYLQLLAILEQIADGILCYFWLKGRHFKEEESFLAAAMLVLAGPLIYHSSMQFMFVSYMPFLLMALMGYDRYCRTGKYALMTVGVLCMVLNNFYFALGGVAVLLIYGLCGWQKEWASSPAVLVKSLWRQFYPALLGGFLSFFYLIPTVWAMMAGRTAGEKMTAGEMLELFVPGADIDKIVYQPYGMGLTALAAVMVGVSLFYRKCREKYMAATLAVLLIFPVFDWILNGTLYLRSKVFIPCLPLVCYLTAAFLTRFKKGVIAPWKLAAGFVTAAAFLIFGVMQVQPSKYGGYEVYVLLADLAVAGGALLVGRKFWRRAVGTGLLLAMCLNCLLQIGAAREDFVKEEWMQDFQNEDVEEAVRQTVERGGFLRVETRGTQEQNKASDNQVIVPGQNVTSCYSSVSNPYYKAFREDELHLALPTRNILMEELSGNPLFLKVMGVRYLIVRPGSGTDVPEGYVKTGSVGEADIYENEAAFPIGYVTDRVMPEEDFEELTWQEKQLALQSSAVVPEMSDDTKTEDSDAGKQEGLRAAFLAGLKDAYHIQLDKTKKFSLPLKDRQEGEQYLFISFDVKNNRGSSDVWITIEGEKNKLTAKSALYYNENTTFCYTCSLADGKDELEIQLSRGDYEISDIQAWYAKDTVDSGDWQTDAGLVLSGDGDRLEGNVRTAADGWLITSIPYDENFEIRVDGRKEDTKKVNHGFVGTKLTAGEHRIEIVYHAPGRMAGAAMTAAAALALLADRLLKNKRGT